MRLSRLLLAGLLLGSGCGGEGDLPGLLVPATGTDYVIWASAPEGRTANPTSVRVARFADVSTVVPESIGGSDVDLFFAGLDPEDLPAGISPIDLEFIRPNDDGARDLPVLHAPHVLNEPTAPGRSAVLVPADDEDLPLSLRAERSERFRKMIEGLRIKDPCSEPLTPFTIVTPRTQGEDVRAFRTLSSGETFVALSATSTAITGVLTPGAQELEVLGVGTGTTAVLPGDRARIFDLGDTEVLNREGRLVPGVLTVNLIGAFRGIGTLFGYDGAAKRWYEDIPMDPAAEANGIAHGLLGGARHVELEGVPSLCAYGAARGPNRVAAIWCRTQTSTVWTLSGRFAEAYAISDIMVREPPLSPIALDVTGAVYEHRARGWEPVARTAINDGCMPPCVTFSTTVVQRSGAALSIVTGGSHAQILTIESDGSGRISLGTIDAVAEALFADERRGADSPVAFSSAAFSPDGALWLGSQRNFLLRVDRDRSEARRVCLPRETLGAAVTAIEAHPDGHLYLGMTPALLGFGDWRL